MAEEKKYQSRMGDGSLVFMTEEEIRADMREGMADAVKRGKIDPMSEEDFERLYEIITMPGGVVGVEPGKEITFDNVIAVSDDNTLKVAGDVSSAKVNATVVEQGRGKKVIVYKYKRKTGYHKKNGHRQPFTLVKINKISM